MKQAILDKLAEIETMLQSTTCEGEAFGINLQEFDDWAGELDLAVRTLAEKIDYYVD